MRKTITDNPIKITIEIDPQELMALFRESVKEESAEPQATEPESEKPSELEEQLAKAEQEYERMKSRKNVRPLDLAHQAVRIKGIKRRIAKQQEVKV